MNKQINLSGIEPGTRILFANIPADGHFNPLTGLAVHLKKMGCDVRWYTSPSYENKVRSLGIPFFPFKKAFDVSLANKEIEEVFPDRKKYKSQISKLKYDLVNVFILRSPEYYADIREIYEDFPFELMVADITFGGIPFVKEKMGIPVMSVSVVPLPETSKDLPPSGLGLTPKPGMFNRIKQSILRFIADTLIFAGPTKVMRRILKDHGIDPGKANIFDLLIRKSTLVLQSGTPGFEYKRSDMSEHIYFAGPLLPYHRKKDRQPWQHEKLGRYKKVILVTQGTVEKDVDKLVVPALEAFKNTGYLVVVTTGGSKTSVLRKKYPYENVIIEDFIPFDDIMPYADVYISNGGYGGVLLSIKHGIPMVVGGIHEGKNEINARVGYFKLGVNLKTEKPGVARLRQGVAEIFNNPVYSANVQKLSREFSEYHPEEIGARYAAVLLRRSRRLKVKATSDMEFIY